ncbi:EamA family transporter [Pedobacter sp. MC2016-05]|uniref:EamA family transporter n=1 Tax=Pedobacter sp. MC2016-05 TaxID=2994474 RepID=UPI00224725EC|nr:EamA family transporter [Pedobacter sp. MC2016-05]MCX2476394.1 EamA family transporter [Pedobacter sp. MC2016-05]
MATARAKYFVAGIIPYIIWGTMSIPLRNIKGFPPQEILYYRIFVSIIMVWTIILLFRKDALKNDFNFFKNLISPKKTKFLLLTLLSAFLITGNWFTYIYAVNSVSLRAAAFAYMVCPLLTALCGFVILKEQLTRTKVIALIIASMSIALLATGSLREVLWAILIASFYALYVIVLKIIKGIDKFNFLGVQLILSGLMLLPMYLFTPNTFPVDNFFWSHIFLIAAVFTIIPLFLNSYALLGMPSSALGILIYLNPIVAFAVAFFYFKEPIDVLQLFAYLLLLLSIVIFNAQLLKSIVYKKA